MAMTITLTDQQEAAVAALVAAGDFSSIDEALSKIVRAGLMYLDPDLLDDDESEEGYNAELDLKNIDVAYVKSLIAVAEEQYKRGEFLTLEESNREAAELIDRLAARKQA